MAQDLFHYDKMVEAALRGVVREALLRVAKEGLRSNHHFYIGFATAAPGVVVPPSLRAAYPDEMTIVLQHQFWDLEIGSDSFSVTLSFHNQPERLSVPFAAIRSFADPSVEFGLRFEAAEAPGRAGLLPAPVAAPAETDAPGMAAPGTAAPGTAAPGTAAGPAAATADKSARPAGEVVALDAFRKR
jgi:hypothetical protein